MSTRTLRTLAATSAAVALGAGTVTLAAPAASAPAPRGQAAGSTAPTASSAATPSSSASATASVSPRASATAAPAPSGAPSDCAVQTTAALRPTVVLAGRPAQVAVTGTPGSTVRLLAHSAPSTSYFQARETTLPADGRVLFSVVPPTNTSLYAQQVGCDPSETLLLGVRTAVGLSAVRNGARDYTFTGTTLPRAPGRLVSLYRLTASGAQVLTSQARTDRAGRWSLRRVFTGSGRFDLVARTGADFNNLAGSSSVRPTVIH